MRIGIMSMQRVANYGSYLQAYGLKKVIESLGHEVEFVDYLAEPSVVDGEGEVRQPQWYTKILKCVKMLFPTYRKYRNEQIQINRTFTEFVCEYHNQFLLEMGIEEKRNYCPKLDVLVIGSDEVFNCTQEGILVGYSRQLFGKDHKSKKLVSYAASFGNTTIEKLKKYQIDNEIKEYLLGFDNISVRDNNSRDIIEELCGVLPEKHIDPVLLYDFSEVDPMQVDKKDYIIVYAYAGSIKDDEAKVIRNFAKSKGKRILCLGFYQPFCDEYILAKPLEVLAYIRNADYVITDTFHGTVFSIKYQVPFATIIRQRNEQKLGDLLSTFQMEERRIFDLEEFPQILGRKIDKEKIQQIIKTEQKKAVYFLASKLCEE